MLRLTIFFRRYTRGLIQFLPNHGFPDSVYSRPVTCSPIWAADPLCHPGLSVLSPGKTRTTPYWFPMMMMGQMCLLTIELEHNTTIGHLNLHTRAYHPWPGNSLLDFMRLLFTDRIRERCLNLTVCCLYTTLMLCTWEGGWPT